MTDEPPALIEVERVRLSLMFTLYAGSRDLEATATGDARYIAPPIASGGSWRHWIRSAMTCCCGWRPSTNYPKVQLIAARIEQVGGALPCYPDAAAFFEPITQQVDVILRNARQHMH